MYTASNNLNASAVNITNWYGFRVPANALATNVFGFRGEVNSGTGRWNLYMSGTAVNHISANLLIGQTNDTGEKLQVTGTANITGNLTLTGARLLINGSNANSKINLTGTQATPAGASQIINATINISPAGAVTTFDSWLNFMTFVNSSFNVTTYNGVTSRVDFNANYTGTVSNLNLFQAYGIGALGGATISNLRGFVCNDLTAVGVNIGFQSAVSAGTNKWNAYFNGTANNYINGAVLIGSNTPNAAAEKLQVTGAAAFSSSLLLARLTTALRDALTPANGMIIYNSETNKFQGYENGAWVNLI